VRALFVLRSAEFGRYFERMLDLLGERGHEVHIVVERGRGAGFSQAIRTVTAEHRSLTSGKSPLSRSDFAELAPSLRYGIDFLRFLSPAYRDAPRLRSRAMGRAPAPVRRLAESRIGRTRPAVALARRTLRTLERAVPVPPGILDYVERRAPDVVLVSTLVDGGEQVDYVRAARMLGIPTGLVVASWDNLTNKGVIHEVPDRVYVWNDIQRREAVELHGVPRKRVEVVGAHSFDHWFEWTPSTTRWEFCAQVGLDPTRPFILYLCSSRFIAKGIEGSETAFIRRWLEGLRASGHDGLRQAGVLVRPHPRTASDWRENPLAGMPDVAVWPPQGQEPQEEQAKRDYFDSIYHSAAVAGINTSALIEAAIVGRRSYTWRAPEYRRSQVGTLHFHYLEAENGGPVVAADEFEEHASQLASALAQDADGDWSRPFVESFVRPAGLDVPAAPLLVDDIETLAAAPAGAPRRTSLTARVLRRLVLPRLASRTVAAAVDDDEVEERPTPAGEISAPPEPAHTPPAAVPQAAVPDRRAKKEARRERRRKESERRAASDPSSPSAVASLVREAAERDPAALKASLESEGYALFAKQPQHHYVPSYYGNRFRKLRSPLEDPEFFPLAQKVVDERRTFLYYNRLYTLYQSVHNALAGRNGGPLDILEVGVFKGGSSYFLASLARRLAPGRARLVAVDTFEGHSALDLPAGREGRHAPETFGNTSYESVASYLSEFDFAEVKKGRIQDVAESLGDRRWHVAHLDVDIYEPTAFTLSFLEDRIVPGGIIVVDDYNFTTCPGVKKAVDEFAERSSGRFFKLDLDSGQCCLIALAPTNGGGG
jgi:hypothetical protein